MMVAERNHDRPRQRGQVDNGFRLEMLLRIPKHVGQHEAAFGIGILDLDRLARG
jgi:hypothetical protein